MHAMKVRHGVRVYARPLQMPAPYPIAASRIWDEE